MPFCHFLFNIMHWHIFECRVSGMDVKPIKNIITMTLVRYNKDYVPTRWNSLLDNFFTDPAWGGTRDKFVPTVDIVETDAAFEVHVAVLGMKKEDFHIEIEDRNLVISGERKWKDEKTEKNFRRLETQFGSFRRSFTLPQNVNEEKISASYNDGILEIEIPKDEQKELKSVIKVK